MVRSYFGNRPIIRAMHRYFKRVVGVFRWALTITRILLPPITKKDRRLLIVYDLASQPLSVGDILMFQEASLVLRELHGLETVDFAIVYDPKKPVISDPALSHISSENFQFHLSSLTPVAQVNPHLGSLFLLDSHRFLESLIADNATTYEVWPPLSLYSGREYLFYHCFNELFYRFFAEHGTLPDLRSRPAVKLWADRFIKQHAPSGFAASVQLRRNPRNPARDSKHEAWLPFFRYCAERFPVTFIVVGAASEVDARLRDFPNVVLAKDHLTTLEQDLALIESADLHLGAASGPSTIAQFNRKPYCIFSWRINPALFRGITSDGHRNHFYFSTEFQSWITEPETTESLITEFERMWAHLKMQSAAGEAAKG